MSSNLVSFVDAFMARKKLREHATDDMKNFHGQLRKNLQSFTDDIDELIPHFEKVMHRLTHLQHSDHSGQAWDNHWKIVSMDGYDIYKNRSIDYGNKEYYLLLGLICHKSDYCYSCMVRLGEHHFETLHPNARLTKHSMEMQADIIEICMAAFRGNPDFTDVFTPGQPPEIHAKLVAVCRVIQTLDSIIRTGYLKWKQDRVLKLSQMRPDLVNHPFVQSWFCEGYSKLLARLYRKCFEIGSTHLPRLIATQGESSRPWSTESGDVLQASRCVQSFWVVIEEQN